MVVLRTSGSTVVSPFVDILSARAQDHPDRILYKFLNENGREAAQVSFGELDCRARAIAASLQAHEAAGERALLLYPPGLEFISGFLGCLYAGVVAVPAYPPRPNRPDPRLHAIAGDTRCRFALTTRGLLEQFGGSATPQIPELAAATWIATDEVEDAQAEEWRPDRLRGDDLAFLQYTSGSTAAPRGVMVSHAGLCYNAEMIRTAFGQSERSVVVGWLPTYHDMGLIGNVLQPLYAGGRCVLMAPVTFLRRPVRWLEAISRYGGTTSGGPNFSYDLCVRKISEEEKRSLDLSSWEVAFNGAEPVRAEVLDAFSAAFADRGFRAESFYPCYGLAEATLFVSGGLRTSPPRVGAFRAESLERDEGVAADRPGPGVRRLVGCGAPWLGQKLIVVDPETRTRRPEGRVGEIWVHGPSVALGYWDRPEVSEREFRARLADEPEAGPFLRTGDLGFLDGGDLFVSGRLKDLIIVRGRNHYPQDIELTAERSHSALRPGCGATFSVEVDGEERLVVLQEVDRHASDLEAIAEAVRHAVAREHEVGVHEVALLRTGGVLKTSSGKIQRRACRAAYLAGELPVLGRSVLAASTATVEEEVGEPSSDLEELLRIEAARALSLPRSSVDPARPLTALGLDSLSAVALKQEVEARTGLPVSLSSLLQGVSLEELATNLAAAWSRAEGGEGDSLTSPTHPGEEHPLSYGQRALWFLQRWEPESAVYNIAAAAVGSTVDVDALRRALEALVARHAALRTVFGDHQGEPFQRVRESAALDFRVEGIPGVAEEELQARLCAEAFRPFDLASEPLLRVRVWEVAPGRHILLWVVHHIVADFTSAAVLLRDLDRLYRQETGGVPAALPPLSLEYLDYVRWQERYLAGEASERSWHYWRERLGGELPQLALPTDRPRPPVLSGRSATLALRLGPDTSGLLRALGRSSGTTLFTVLLTAFQALLQRHSGQPEVLVGSPAAGRAHRGFAELVGYFVQPVVLRTDFSGNPIAADLLLRTRDTVAAALEHQDFPLSLLAQRLHPEREAGRSPLFQAMFVLYPGPVAGDRLAGLPAFALGEEGARIEVGGLELEALPLAESRTEFDLMLAAAESGDGLLASLQYSRDLFDDSSVARMLGHLEVLLAGLADGTDRPVGDLPLLTAAEERHLLAWNVSLEPLPERCLHELFEEQAARAPEAEALVAGGDHLTYAELARRAGRLAHHLLTLGVGPETVVGVCLERSADLVAAVLAVLKAGGAYLPLDPAYPGERLALLLEDAGAGVLITRKALLARLPHPPAQTVLLDSEPPALASGSGNGVRPSVLPGHLAYLIYTSGSTGRPKGVAIPHRSAVALVRWARQVFSDRELAGVLASTSIGFDLSVFELFVPLSWGGRVILVENVLELASLAAAPEVTLVNTVPSAIAELAERGALASGAVTVNLAGEALSAGLVRRLHEQPAVRRLLNLYGPSETTTYSTFAVLPPGQEGVPPIGRPITGTRIYVLDDRLQLVPLGAVGEVHIGGEGVSRGYHGRPDLTAERFVPDPFSPVPGTRLYRSGDLARRRTEDELEFLGRRDHQVKIRGFRIELGEIEAALEAHAQVRQAVVVPYEAAPGDRRLCACLVFAGEPVPAQELRSFLRRTVPDSMVPAAFIALGELPLTPHGKVDRRALPTPVPEEPRRGGRAPSNELEELLAGIWADVLGVERVGVEEDFFELGGHSLLGLRVLARVARALGVELPASALFQAPTVAALAARLAEGGRAEPLTPLGSSPPPGPEPLPLSFAQQRLWFLDRMEPESAAYNVPGAVRLGGPLRAEALEAALGEVVRRHGSLRTRFADEGGEPQQIIAAEVSVAAARIDLTGLPESLRSTEAAAALQAEAGRPFDLSRPPLLRACLLRLTDEEHVLLLTMHHIVSDGLSLQVLFRELATLYGAAVEGRPSTLAPPPQYIDFVLWQRRPLTGDRLERLLAYWRERLAGTPPLELPTDRPRPAVPSSRGGSWRIEVPADRVERLRAASRSLGITPFVLLLGGFAALFARYSGQEDFALGSPVATRGRIETEEMVGLLVNTLVLRADLAGDPSARDLLRRLLEVVVGAQAHQDLPFERLVEELQPQRALHRSPLFQVMVSFLDGPPETAAFPGLRAELLEVDNGTAKFDLTALLRQQDERLHLTLVYRRDLFEAATIDRLGTHYGRLLDGIVADPAVRVSELPLLTEAEVRQLAGAWNPPPVEVPRDRTVHGLFEEQARRTPDRLAVVSRDQQLTYGELTRRADAIARVLRGLGVGPEVLVALGVERSAEAIVGVLGILKAGGAYLPLDPGHPPERLAYMLEDSGAKVLLTRERLLPRFRQTAAEVALLDRLAEPAATTDEALAGRAAAGPENLAYVIYTSGSTGRPKGTLIEHRSVVNLAHALRRAVYGDRPEPLRVSVNAALTFDASVKQIIQLLSGHTLCIIPEEVRRDGDQLLAYLREQRLDVLDCTPSQLTLLLAGGLLESVERPTMVLVGGEAIGAALWQRLADDPRTVFYNVYGPTECTVDAMACAIGSGEDRLTLGRPIANVRIRLLDARLGSVPAGAPAELCIAGAGLARGYLNRPDLTAERFIPDPESAEPGARMYRTGDLVRHLSGGRIEYLGRADHQVKVRGLRIELGEIEARLELYPGIDRAVALLREDTPGNPRLVAYFTGSEALTEAELRLFLRQDLPEPMIPAAFVRLEAFPLSFHGKVDYGRLPSPSAALREITAPRTPLEESLARIWGELLGLDRVGIRDNFFELGGHSLLALQLVARIRQALKVEVPVRLLFEHPTIEELAPILERDVATPATPEPVLGMARRRGGRDLGQLVSEVGRLSPDEVRRRLAERSPQEERS